jgi:two-component system response regulator NreC
MAERSEPRPDQTHATPALELRPDVILMDLGMPGMTGISGIEATREIVQVDAAIRVLMLTIYDQDEFLFEALEAGASGYLLKGATIDELVGDYLRRRQSGETGGEYETLTARELELLPPLLADEDTNEAIALKLGLSTLTVRTHRQRVMQKLNLHTKSELLKYALRRSLISFDE